MNRETRKSETWGQLMKLAQEGDAGAYETLLQDLSQAMRGFVSKRVPEEHFVEDIVQEILIGVHKARHTFDPSRDFRSWVFAVARYKLIDFLRKWSRRNEKESNEEKIDKYAGGSESHDHEEGLSEDLEIALDSLSDRQRMIVKSLKIEGRSVRETADVMGMSESAVKVSAHRAYKSMKEKLERTRERNNG